MVRSAIPSRSATADKAVLARRAPMSHCSHDARSAFAGCRRPVGTLAHQSVAVLLVLLLISSICGVAIAGSGTAARVAAGVRPSFRRVLLLLRLLMRVVHLLLLLSHLLLLSRQESGLMQVDMRFAKGSVAVGELRCAIRRRASREDG